VTNITKQKPFSKLTDAEKRVTIAKDVLKQLRAKRLIATHMVYFNSEKVEEFYSQTIFNRDTELELSEVIKDEKCNVCALGSLFVCAVDRLDKLKLINFGRCQMQDYLMFFSKKQLDLIECVFEKDMGFMSEYMSKYKSKYKLDLKIAINYTKGIRSPAKQMEKIMKNIIRNKGTFILPKK